MAAHKIVIVEDDRDILDLLERFLSLLPEVTVLKESDGIAALRRIRAEEPDLIILDINLPGKNGTEICKELRSDAKFKQVPIFAYTSLSGRKNKKKILAAGFSMYIPKSTKMKKLVNKVKQTLHK